MMPGAGVTCRAERPDDHRAIADVVAAAFGSRAEAELVENIRESEYFIPQLSVVAESDGRIVVVGTAGGGAPVDGNRRHGASSDDIERHRNLRRQFPGSLHIARTTFG